jgi:hemerythrin
MHIYEWKSQYDVGLQLIDVEHKNLIACINKLIIAQNLDQHIVLKLADEVIAYAEFHFLSEENIMYLTQYPELASHAEIHKKLIEQLREHRKDLSKSVHCLQDFVTFLVRWFIEHTQTVDPDVAKHVLNYKPLPNTPEYMIQKIAKEHYES